MNFHRTLSASILVSLGIIAGCGPGYMFSPADAQAKESGMTSQNQRQDVRSPHGPSESVYDFTLDDIDGKPLPLSRFKGKVLLLVNTASFCGNTPQYEQLQAMYEQYQRQGLEILAFPANNFGQQEPGTNAEIKTFCYTKYSLTFPLFSKVSVKGDDIHPLYKYLTKDSPFPGDVEWNFQKYLVDRQGRVIARYHHRKQPMSADIVADIERTLASN